MSSLMGTQVAMKSYPAYKPSGVEWLGEIPRHWEVKRLKFVLSRNDGGVWGDDFDEDGVIVLRSTDMTLDGGWNIINPAKRKLTIAEYKATQLIEGDLVVTKSSGSELHLGKTAFVTAEIEELNCCFSNFMQRLRTRAELNTKYLWRLINGPMGREQLNYFGSTTTGLANLSGNIIGCLHIPLPPIPEQHTIAAYLDRETAKLDALVAKKERLVELLQEKRAALISHAVTKGLDPTAPMKDSGVEWLGEIPEHWAVGRLKHLTKSMTAGPFGSSLTKDMYTTEGYKVYGQEQVIPADFSIGDYYISEKMYHSMRRYAVSVGDVLVSCVGTFGKVAVVPLEAKAGIINPRLAKLTPQKQVITSEYLGLLLASRIAFDQMEQVSRGGTMDIINLSLLSEVRLPLPSIEQQHLITAYLNRETAKIDALIAKIREQVEILKEHRVALITAAVTGKIDVRGENG